MLSYFGLVDDFAARHHDGAITSSPSLTRNLIFSVLFDEPLLINDGHIIASEVIRDAIVKPKKSPLRELVEIGYVKILTRNQRDLGSLAERMADEGMQPAQALLKSPGYPTFKRALSGWSETLGDQQADGSYLSFRDWPAHNTSVIFERLALAALSQALSNIDDPDQRLQLKKFGDRFKALERRNRTTWETEVNHLRAAKEVSPKIRKTLLHIANEAYQYSWGCALSTTKAPVKVHTRSPEFLDIDVSLTLDQTLDETPKLRQGVTIYVPDIALAARKIGHNWTRLTEVNQANRDVCKAKHRYLKMLEKYSTSSAVSDKDMKECADAYSKQLTMHFGGEGVPLMFDLGVTGASIAVPAAIGGAVAGPVGAGLGFGISLVGTLAAHMGGPKFIRRLTLPLNKKWIRPQSGKKSTSTSCFQVNPATAAAFLEGVPTFKQ